MLLFGEPSFIFFNNFVWSMITYEGSVLKMRIWSIPLLKSDFK